MKKNIDLVVCTGFRIHAVKRKHGGKRMNIKEVEKVTGISSQNIRFYEKSGLVHPDRNEENGYREYDTNLHQYLLLSCTFPSNVHIL